jgi:nitric oxide reductase subunit B
MTFVLRETVTDEAWGLNIRLAMMVVLSLFPGGIMQVRDVIENGYWHRR